MKLHPVDVFMRDGGHERMSITRFGRNVPALIAYYESETRTCR